MGAWPSPPSTCFSEVMIIKKEIKAAADECCVSGLETFLKSFQCFTSKQRFKTLPLGITTAPRRSFQLFTSFFTAIPFHFSSDVLNRSQLCTTGLDSLLSSKCRLSPELLAVLVIISPPPPLLLHTHTHPSLPPHVSFLHCRAGNTFYPPNLLHSDSADLGKRKTPHLAPVSLRKLELIDLSRLSDFICVAPLSSNERLPFSRCPLAEAVQFFVN